MSDMERFMRKVERPANDDDCWIWRGARTHAGYGRCMVIGKPNATTAHRVSFELFRGPIPSGHFVLHRCDNPSCVNPAHLFTGDHAANMLDMVEKGRSHSPRLKGERHGRARLTEAQVIEIRAVGARYGWREKRLARHFGIPSTLAWSALHNWQHVIPEASAAD